MESTEKNPHDLWEAARVLTSIPFPLHLYIALSYSLHPPFFCLLILLSHWPEMSPSPSPSFYPANLYHDRLIKRMIIKQTFLDCVVRAGLSFHSVVGLLLHLILLTPLGQRLSLSPFYKEETEPQRGEVIAHGEAAVIASGGAGIHNHWLDLRLHTFDHKIP